MKFRKGVPFVFKQGDPSNFLSGDPANFEQGQVSPRKKGRGSVYILLVKRTHSVLNWANVNRADEDGADYETALHAHYRD